LRRANQKFTDRFQKLENVFEASGRSIHNSTLDEMESVWQEIKNTNKAPKTI